MTKQNKRNALPNKANNNQAKNVNRNSAKSIMALRSVSAPVSYSGLINNQEPRFSAYQGGLRVRHSEYVGDLVSTGTSLFSLSGAYPINPGLTGTFSWLSNVAANFEWYRFEKLKFYTRTLLPTSTAGGIYMSIDYDSYDDVILSKAAFMASPSAGSGPIWASVCVEFDARNADAYKKRLIRVLSGSSVTAPNSYDAGRMFVAFDNYSGATPGDLMVEYDVVLFTPQIGPNDSVADSERLSISLTQPGLTSALVSSAGNYDIAEIVTSTTANTGKLMFKTPGQYLIDWAYAAASAAGTATPTWSIVSGSGVVSSLNGSIDATAAQPYGTSQAIVNIYEGQTVVQMVLAAALTTLSYNTVRIAKYGYANA
jgi:hypothetical protein